MGRKITLTNEALEMLIQNWDIYENYATQNLVILEDSLSELRRFNTEHIPLSDTRKAHLDRFSVIIHNMSCYTT